MPEATEISASSVIRNLLCKALMVASAELGTGEMQVFNREDGGIEGIVVCLYGAPQEVMQRVVESVSDTSSQPKSKIIVPEA